METWSFDFEADNTSDNITSDTTTSNNTTSGNTTTSGNNTNDYKRVSTVDDFILPVPGAYFCVCPQVAGLRFFSTNFLPPYVAFVIWTHISRASPWPGTFEGRSTNWATAPRLQQLMMANQATSFNRRLIATFVGKTNSPKKNRNRSTGNLIVSVFFKGFVSSSADFVHCRWFSSLRVSFEDDVCWWFYSMVSFKIMVHSLIEN